MSRQEDVASLWRGRAGAPRALGGGGRRRPLALGGRGRQAVRFPHLQHGDHAPAACMAGSLGASSRPRPPSLAAGASPAPCCAPMLLFRIALTLGLPFCLNAKPVHCVVTVQPQHVQRRSSAASHLFTGNRAFVRQQIDAVLTVLKRNGRRVQCCVVASGGRSVGRAPRRPHVCVRVCVGGEIKIWPACRYCLVRRPCSSYSTSCWAAVRSCTTFTTCFTAKPGTAASASRAMAGSAAGRATPAVERQGRQRQKLGRAETAGQSPQLLRCRIFVREGQGSKSRAAMPHPAPAAGPPGPRAAPPRAPATAAS